MSSLADFVHQQKGLLLSITPALFYDQVFGCLNKIPNDHAIYSSFFKFEGPPRTSIELNGWGDDLVHNYLKAIEIDGRIAVLYSNKDLGCEWDYDFRNKRWLKEDNTRFAVNIVMYAMNS